MFISSRDGFVTNTKYDCERTLRRQSQRRDRRVGGNPCISGPVYVNRMQEPIVPDFLKAEREAKKENSLLSKIGAFFAAMSASVSEAREAELTPNVYMNDGDLLILQSMEDSAVEYETEEAAQEALKASKKPYQSKRSIKNAEKLAARRAAEAARAAQEPNVLDLKNDIEAQARGYARQRDELKTEILGHFDSMPETGAFRYLSKEVLDDMNNEDLAELLAEIQNRKDIESTTELVFNKDNWIKTQEYLLFSEEVNITEFLDMLQKSRKTLLSAVESESLFDWASRDSGAKADFRLNGDVEHNWNVQNLKIVTRQAYELSCEDAGKLDHDPVLKFPNGTKTRLSRFIGYDNFDKIAEPGARDTNFFKTLKKAG